MSSQPKKHDLYVPETGILSHYLTTIFVECTTVLYINGIRYKFT